MADEILMSADDVKSTLINVAKKHFATYGFQGANLKDIAAEAKVANSLINYHFKDKEGLLHACMEPFARGRMEAVLRILGEPRSRDEIKVRVQLFAEEMLDGFSKDPYGFEIIEREIRAANPIILKIFENTMLRAFTAVVSFFEEAKNNGLLRNEVDPMIAASLMFVSCCDAARKDVLARKYYGLSFKDEAFRKKFADHIVQLFADGVLK